MGSHHGLFFYIQGIIFFHMVLWFGCMAWTFDFAHKSYFNVEFEIPINFFLCGKISPNGKTKKKVGDMYVTKKSEKNIKNCQKLGFQSDI
jgi:hypothetical protein